MLQSLNVILHARQLQRLTKSYAPRTGCAQLLDLVNRLAAVNRSDTCIVSGEKLRELLLAWYGLRRSIRWIWYHLKALHRDHFIIRQTRWRAVGGKILLKARTRYRLGWRYMQVQMRAARHGLRLAALVPNGPRRETVQKVALGLQNLLSSVVPRAKLDAILASEKVQ